MESLLSIASTTDATAVEHSGHYSPFQDQDRSSFTPPVSSSTPDYPAKIKGHSRHGSQGSKRQLFQNIKTEFDQIPVEGGERNPTESSILLDKVQRIRGLSPLVVEKTNNKQEVFPKGGRLTREQQEPNDEEPKIGFIACDGIVALYLSVLKDCLMDLNAARMKQNRSGN
jgi:hypothetical protein